MLQWGTLDPVAAYLLNRRYEITRSDAEQAAQHYYEEHASSAGTPNDLLDASKIRDWADGQYRTPPVGPATIGPPIAMPVQLLRDFSSQQVQEWRVIPVEAERQILWFDPAGFQLATSERPINWESDWLDMFDFTLDVSRQQVSTVAFV